MAKKRNAGFLEYEALFEEPSTEERLELMRSPEISGYRRRTITSGEYREIEIFPLYRGQKKRREARQAVTGEAQQRVNARNSALRLRRLAQANFIPFRDLIMSFSYEDRPCAPTLEEGKRDIVNYLKRVKRYRKNHGMPPLKYIYVIHYEEDGRAVRVNHHLIMSEMDRDEAEAIWGKGRAKSDRLKPDDKGLIELAAYITRSRRGNKRWCASRNLKEPEVKFADYLFTHRQAEKMAADCQIAAKQIFERVYRKYQFVECEAKYNDEFPGAHFYVQMRKRPAAEKRKRGCA